LPPARRWCDDGDPHPTRLAVIVRLDRTIQYAVRYPCHSVPLCLLDARVRGHDGKKRREAIMNQPASAYFIEDRHDPRETHTLSVLVQNEPGVLARVIGLFSGRGYNIESLTVSETESQKHLSRITIVTTGTPMVIEQIKHQLDRMVPVYRVVDMTLTGRSIERELAMVKVRGAGEHRVETLRLADAFRARVIDATIESFVFEITGNTSKINQFIDLMRPLGLVEVSRTGVAAIARGPEGM
jgi:acetolactate synthase-1/3 small subunit